MKIIINYDKQKLLNFIRSNGYKKQNNLEGYVKQIKGGRLHLIIQELNNQTIIELHYDKFKGNKNKKFKHSTINMNPSIKKDLDYIKKYCNQKGEKTK